jgi:hypothetical protein
LSAATSPPVRFQVAKIFPSSLPDIVSPITFPAKFSIIGAVNPSLTITPVLTDSTHSGSVASFFASTLIVYVPASKFLIS